VLKVMALGPAGHAFAYLADGWNCLDLVVVVAAWLPILFPGLVSARSSAPWRLCLRHGSHTSAATAAPHCRR
jgi:hypothetical protein